MAPVKRAVILTVALLLILFVASFAIFYSRIAVFVFARQNNIEIIYRQLDYGGLNEFVFKDLRAFDKKHGVGLSASSARVKLISAGQPTVNPTADFILNDVNFIKKGLEKESSYNNIDGLVSLPFSSLWRYKTISGKVSSLKNGIMVKDFLATGDLIRFSCDGALTDKNIVDADIVIYFEKGLTGKIPAELSNMALRDEVGEWKSLSIKLEGDLAKPAIRVTGKLFRLNIGVK